MALGLGLIIAIILFKYKPTYVVSLCGEQIGYVSNAAELQNRIQSEIIDMDGENIDFVTLDNMPKYELKLVEKSLTTNEDEIMLALKDDAKVMYKYYAVILNAETITYVDNIEEAEEAVEQIKEEHKDDTIQLDLAVTTNYTENINEIGIQSVEVAKQEVEQKFISTLALKIAKDASIANTKEEVDGLMNELLILNNPFIGPLGEPIAIKMSKYDIERKFARK